jgi:hypothetical protein
MLQTFVGWLQALTGVPWQVWAMALAWLLSVGFTQAAKPWAPEGWSDKALDRGAQLVAFVSAIATCVLLWPDRWGLAAGVAVGLWSPFSWWLLRRIARHRWPKVFDAMGRRE